MSTPSDATGFPPTYAPWYLDAAALLAEPDPGPTAWLVESLIVDRALVAVVGRWKTTKSYGVLEVCISIATGRPAFGTFAVPEPGPVVFVNEESGKAALWRRLDALCRGRAIEPEELRGRLFVAPNAGVKLDDEQWQERLRSELGALRPRLIVFDPLARMKAASRKENEQEGMAPLIEFLRELRERTNAAVLFVHHTGHQGEHMRGSSDLETAWETRLRWKRDGQSAEVTIESEHREADAAAPFTYRIAWDGLTRSMRFEAVADADVERLRAYLVDHPDASAYAAHKDLGGKRKSWFIEWVQRLRADGSEAGNLVGTDPLDQTPGDGSREGLFEPPGTAGTGGPAETVPEPGATPSQDDLDERPVGWLSDDLAHLACVVCEEPLDDLASVRCSMCRGAEAA